MKAKIGKPTRVEQILPHQTESTHRKNVNSRTKLMAFGSLGFSYLLKVWWVIVRWSTCCSQNTAKEFTCKRRKRKRKGIRKEDFPCPQLLYTALSTLIWHLSSGLVLLGKGRSFICVFHSPGEGALFRQLWVEGCKLLSLSLLSHHSWYILNPETPVLLEVKQMCNGGRPSFFFGVFFPEIPLRHHSTCMFKCGNKWKNNLPCRIGYNKCFWKKILSRSYTLELYSSKYIH